jgi:hypothetical protein
MEALSNFQIQRFFEESSPIPRKACDEAAAAIHGVGTVKPVDLQGADSYTVCVHDGTSEFVVQFREPNRPLDIDVQDAARETYGPLVPRCQYLEGRLDPLHVYTMEKISGESFLLSRTPLHRPENLTLLSQTVKDFAA